jgi:hypothetical protein
MYYCPFLQNQHLFFYKRKQPTRICHNTQQHVWVSLTSMPGSPSYGRRPGSVIRDQYCYSSSFISSVCTILLRSEPSECPPPWSVLGPGPFDGLILRSGRRFLGRADWLMMPRAGIGIDGLQVMTMHGSLMWERAPWLWAAVPCYLSSK